MSLHPEGVSPPIRVLIVCTGNICRSPLAEQLLRLEASKAGFGSQVVFESAGTRAEVGQPTNPSSVKSASTRGIPPFSIVARQLTEHMINSAELVLTATTEHRGDVVRLVTSANRKTFTIKEFVRILEFFDAENEHLEDIDRTAIKSASTLIEKMTLAAQYRGYAPRSSEGDDITDPWGRPTEIFDQVTDELIENVQRLVTAIAPVVKREN